MGNHGFAISKTNIALTTLQPEINTSERDSWRRGNMDKGNQNLGCSIILDRWHVEAIDEELKSNVFCRQAANIFQLADLANLPFKLNS